MPTPRTPLPRAALAAVGEAQNATEEAARLIRQLFRKRPEDTDLAAALASLARAESRLSEARQIGKGGGTPRSTQGGPMLTRAKEEEIKASLTKTLEQWLQDDSSGDRGEWPYIGDGLAEIMATAALQPLRAIADAQDYLDQEGMLKGG